MSDYISREDLLKVLDDKQKAWEHLKGKQQDVVTEDFVSNVAFILSWVVDTVEHFPAGIIKTA